MAAQLIRNFLATAMLIVAGATVAIMALGAMSNNRTIQNYGIVKAINVGVYWNSECTNVTSIVNWGILAPGNSKNITFYVRNEGNVAMRLSLTTQNWNPTNASNYMRLTWNREGQIINSGYTLQATLTLSVFSSISRITNFSFDIVITGIEQ